MFCEKKTNVRNAPLNKRFLLRLLNSSVFSSVRKGTTYNAHRFWNDPCSTLVFLTEHYTKLFNNRSNNRSLSGAPCMLGFLTEQYTYSDIWISYSNYIIFVLICKYSLLSVLNSIKNHIYRRSIDVISSPV